MNLAAVVAENVRALRGAAGLSQDALAARLQRTGLNASRNSLAWLEAGRKEPTLSEFLLLAAALDTKPAELLRAPEGVETVGLGDEAGIPAALLPGLLQGKGFKDLEPPEYETAASEAEKVAARKLGLTFDQVQELGWYLWEDRLDAERDERAGHPTGTDASSRMRKAHATRKLMVELTDEARERGWLAAGERATDATKDPGAANIRRRARKEQRP